MISFKQWCENTYKQYEPAKASEYGTPLSRGPRNPSMYVWTSGPNAGSDAGVSGMSPQEIRALISQGHLKTKSVHGLMNQVVDRDLQALEDEE